MTRQRTATTSDERSDGTLSATDLSVTMIATPGDASCGIGTYGRDLRAALEDGGGSPERGDGGLGDGEPADAASADGEPGEGGPGHGEPGAAGDRAATDLIELEQDGPTAAHFLGVALRAAAGDADVVHVQHEYGLFRRPGSIYPGLFGLLFFPALWLLTRIRGQSIVVTLHSVLTPAPEEARFSKRLFLLVSHELIARVADHVIFLSEDCEERFHEDVAQDPGEFSVLPHGVNVRDATAVDRATAKERFGFDRDDRVVAIPGFIRPPKGHDVFVEVARELPEVEFLIAGGARPKGFDQGFVQQIETDAPENVTITGVLDDEDFPVALAAADLALLPYRVVTQSGTFNWCAAQELPVLASDQSYFERIESEWDALETVGLEDVERIAARVEALLADDVRRAELSRNVRAFKEANSFEAVAADHLAIYWSTLGGPSLSAAETEDASTEPAESEPVLAACSAQREAPATSD